MKYMQGFIGFLALFFASASIDVNVLTKFVGSLVKTKQSVLFSCSKKELYMNSLALMKYNQLVYPIHVNKSYLLRSILTRKNYARTTIIVNTECEESMHHLLAEASSGKYLNKTYQWLLWGVNQDLDYILPIQLNYIGPNAQITFVNQSHSAYSLWDIHSKGRHLNADLEIKPIAKIYNNFQLVIINDIFELQSTKYRGQFNRLVLRGASVIDQENVMSNKQIEEILSRPTKDSGVAAFIKYHYELLTLLRDRFNFSVKFRNSRGWAGRLGNTTFRLGLLGIIMRNEADIAASGAFNRINRFAEFDIIDQSWKFKTAFLYRFTPDLNIHGESGNFLAPFSKNVWYIALTTLMVTNLMWWLIDFLKRKYNYNQNNNSTKADASGKTSGRKWTEIALHTFAAVCQQGMEPVPKSLQSRFIVVTIFLFSLVMYNYYTSSVVGGLLSSSEQGPGTVSEITYSPLKLSFEDIGYYKVLFRESTNPLVTDLISRKLSSGRAPNELPIYTHLEEAVPYIKSGGLAFHCEVVDAYPIIAELFDADEICDLREVTGLMEVEYMNWILHKNSQYTELFKTAMCYAHENGLVERIIRRRQIRKPPCQSLYTVYPVALSGVLSAFYILIAGIIGSIIALCLEILYRKLKTVNSIVN